MTHTPRSDANSRGSKWYSHSTSHKAAHMPEDGIGTAYGMFVIYLSARLCWSVWCYVMCGCGRMLHQLDPSPHTPAGLRQIPPMCYSSHNPSNFTMNSVFIFLEESTSAACACGSRFHWFVVVTRAFHVLWYSMTLSMYIRLRSDWFSFIILLQLTKLVRKAAAQHDALFEVHVHTTNG